MTADARWRAWGTDVHVVVADPRELAVAVHLVRARIAAVDAAASRFQPASELRRLRAGAQRVSPLLATLVGTALAVARETDGLVDPTLGAALAAAGYDRTFAELPASSGVATLLRPTASWRDVHLDADFLTLPPAVELDLGATAKAWLVDDAAARLEHLGVSALVNLGGDLALAGAGEWPVAVGDPGEPTQSVSVSTPLATSSTRRRTWRCDGRLRHHVLDPRTGSSAQRVWRTVTVAAETCVAANAASTAAVVLGQDAPVWLAARELPARLVRADGVVVRVAGWPATGERAA